MKSGEVELAASVFQLMRRHERDKISWTVLIDGFIKNGLFEEALQQFQEMQYEQQQQRLYRNQVEPDYVMIIALLAACADLGALGLGLWVHRYAMTRCSADVCSKVRLANSLIDMYSRCGRVELARQVFDMVENEKRTRVSWNSMIVGFAINGCCREALDHFDTMLRMGFMPDGISFTGALTACSHAGMVDEGLRYYELMRQRYSDIPLRIEHYGCVVDLLGRAGRLEEAMSLVERMMPVMGPNEVVLGSLLAACREHKNVDMAEGLMGYLVELEPETDSNFVLLSNIYAAAGRWDGVGKVRNVMKSLGIKKNPGFSAVEIDGALHEFVSGDWGNMQSKNIKGMLELVSFEMKLHRDSCDSEIISMDGSSFSE